MSQASPEEVLVAMWPAGVCAAAKPAGPGVEARTPFGALRLGNRGRMALRISAGATVTGFALGAFFDGILLHQILRWHHLTSRYDLDMDEHVFWDGVFSLAVWLVLVGGLVLLWRELAGPRDALDPARLAGSALVGWGVFHLVDQALFHLALGAHHIRDGGSAGLYDWGFAAIGVALILAGWVVTARPRWARRA